jgi:hypothetical protein
METSNQMVDTVTPVDSQHTAAILYALAGVTLPAIGTLLLSNWHGLSDRLASKQRAQARRSSPLSAVLRGDPRGRTRAGMQLLGSVLIVLGLGSLLLAAATITTGTLRTIALHAALACLGVLVMEALIGAWAFERLERHRQ